MESFGGVLATPVGMVDVLERENSALATPSPKSGVPAAGGQSDTRRDPRDIWLR